SVDADDFSFEDELISGAPTNEVESPVVESTVEEATTEVGVAEPMSALSEEPAEVLEAPADWPWANVEAFTEAAEEDADAVEGTPDEISPEVSSLEDADTLITSAPPIGEEAYVPRPVILGDYAEIGAEDATESVDAAPEADDADEEVEDVAAGGSPFDTAAVEASRPEEAPATEMAYEPTGDLDLGAYTCNDCVYSNTCPKVGEVTPAECGTFQWRSS
ncbi:MAG: hypothetical protein JXP37_05570, partial [Coriobacteriia bacterium]|nr:hypothetical protein [Coriobacteriia bacterium]